MKTFLGTARAWETIRDTPRGPPEGRPSRDTPCRSDGSRPHAPRCRSRRGLIDGAHRVGRRPATRGDCLSSRRLARITRGLARLGLRLVNAVFGRPGSFSPLDTSSSAVAGGLTIAGSGPRPPIASALSFCGQRRKIDCVRSVPKRVTPAAPSRACLEAAIEACRPFTPAQATPADAALSEARIRVSAFAAVRAKPVDAAS